MNILDFKNNALFLSCWYERSRPVQLICIGTLIMSILFLSFLTVAVHESRPEAMWESFFHVIVVVQVLVLLLEGTMFASHMASRERSSGTLDFHRNAPQPVVDKVIGLVFGSAWFEWVIFTGLFIVELPFALLEAVTLKQILLFNASVMLSGILFHTAAAMGSLLSKQKKGINSIVYILLFFWFGLPFLVYAVSSSSSPFFAHLLGAAAFQYIFVDKIWHLTGRFYVFDLPLLMMQVIVQLPMLWLMFNGLIRTFSLPNSLAWSKADVIRFCGFLLFMVTGFFVANYTQLDVTLANAVHVKIYPNTIKGFLQHEIPVFSFLFVMAGLVASFFCVPTYFKRMKYEILSRKGSGQVKGLFDDGATSLIAIIIYVAMGVVFAAPYLSVLDCPAFNGVAYMLILSSYVIAFAGFLEYFRLGRFRNNKIFFMTAMAVVWMFIPWVAALMLSFNLDDNISVASISPVFGAGYAVSLLLDKKSVDMVALAAPCLVAGVMWLLAYQEHAAVEKQAAGTTA